MFDIFKGDPEKIRVAEKLSERLDNMDDWEDSDGDFIKHKTYNIRVRSGQIANPEYMWIPYWCNRIIRKKIRKIYRKFELEKLSFIYDNLDGKYCMHLYRLSDEQKLWFKENATDDQYIERGGVIYISDDTLAMAYKLQWL